MHRALEEQGEIGGNVDVVEPLGRGEAIARSVVIEGELQLHPVLLEREDRRADERPQLDAAARRRNMGVWALYGVVNYLTRMQCGLALDLRSKPRAVSPTPPQPTTPVALVQAEHSSEAEQESDGRLGVGRACALEERASETVE